MVTDGCMVGVLCDCRTDTFTVDDGSYGGGVPPECRFFCGGRGHLRALAVSLGVRSREEQRASVGEMQTMGHGRRQSIGRPHLSGIAQGSEPRRNLCWTGADFGSSGWVRSFSTSS